MMVTVKEAAQRAMDFAQDALGPARTAEIRLEEIDSSDDVWLITLSMANTDPVLGVIAALVVRRDYKIFSVRKDDGEIQSMKIRELANA